MTNRSSLNVLQARMVERLTPWAVEICRNEHLRHSSTNNDFLRSLTTSDYEKATWVYNNRLSKYAERASDWNLWREFVDPDGLMTREEFDDLSAEDKIAAQVDWYGSERAGYTECRFGPE